MVAQSPPYALQNAAHSAQLFRQATFSAWRSQSGIVGPTDFTVAAQSTPNMSIQVAAGRAWMQGTQVAVVSGGNWSPQAGYFGINDAPLSVTVATSDPTNPRIDSVGAWVQDSYYSGASGQVVIGIVTGTPAASPVAPVLPNNSIALATIAVAANATSIVSGNIANFAGNMSVTRGGILPVRSTDTTAGEYVGQFRDHPTLGLQRWNGTAWVPVVQGVGKRIVKTGTQSIGSTWTAISWDATDPLDPGTSGMWTSGNNITAPVKGIYAMGCVIAEATHLQVRVNSGGVYTGGNQVSVVAGLPLGVVASIGDAGFVMNAGDYVTAFVYNSSTQGSGALTGYQAHLSLTLIAALP